jgi:hypothetical protein
MTADDKGGLAAMIYGLYLDHRRTHVGYNATHPNRPLCDDCKKYFVIKAALEAKDIVEGRTKTEGEEFAEIMRLPDPDATFLSATVDNKLAEVKAQVEAATRYLNEGIYDDDSAMAYSIQKARGALGTALKLIAAATATSKEGAK